MSGGWYLPPRDDSFAQALPEVRRRMFDDWRRRSFHSWAELPVRAAQVALHPEAIPE